MAHTFDWLRASQCVIIGLKHFKVTIKLCYDDSFCFHIYNSQCLRQLLSIRCFHVRFFLGKNYILQYPSCLIIFFDIVALMCDSVKRKKNTKRYDQIVSLEKPPLNILWKKCRTNLCNCYQTSIAN